MLEISDGLDSEWLLVRYFEITNFYNEKYFIGSCGSVHTKLMVSWSPSVRLSSLRSVAFRRQ